MKKHVILFLAANPSETGQLALDREAHDIQKELESAGRRDCFDFQTRWAVQPLDLLRELRKLKPTVVHFSGCCGQGAATERQPGPAPRADEDVELGGRNAGPGPGMYFQSSDGHSQFVSAQAIEKTFGAAGGSVKLVVLNACYSDTQAEALVAHVDCVVGTEGLIRNDSARILSIGFYGGLGEQESVAAAYEQGRAAICVVGLPDGDRTQLKVRAGIDAARLVVTEEPAPAPPPHEDGAVSRRSRAPDRHEVFIGRDLELERMGTALVGSSTSRSPVIVVQGMPGVGKTYLAQELYARHRDRFDSYQHVVLDPKHPGTIAVWMRTLGERAGIEPAQADNPVVAELMRAQRTLVHVDNVDSIAAAELAAELARTLDIIPMIITGRYTELGTARGAGWTRIELAPLDPAPALDVLRAELEGTGIAVPEAALCELVRQTAGLPLALHLAAGYLRRGISVERFLTRLRQEGLALSPRDPGDQVLEDRARGILATSFAISRELMLAQAGEEVETWKAALTALGWAPRAGFGCALGAVITGLDEASGAFEDFIDAAASLSLARRLRPDERSTPAWVVQPLLGEFLRADSERAGIDARVTAWVAQRADAAVSDRGTRWSELSNEAASIGEWLGVASEADVGTLLPRACEFATSCGPIGPWLTAAQRVRRGGGGTRNILRMVCQLAFRAGEFEVVLDAATEMARLSREAGNDLDRARAEGQIADVLVARGELTEALRIRREEVLPVVERLGDVQERAFALCKIADVLLIRGELAEALQICRGVVISSVTAGIVRVPWAGSPMRCLLAASWRRRCGFAGRRSCRSTNGSGICYRARSHWAGLQRYCSPAATWRRRCGFAGRRSCRSTNGSGMCGYVRSRWARSRMFCLPARSWTRRCGSVARSCCRSTSDSTMCGRVRSPWGRSPTSCLLVAS